MVMWRCNVSLNFGVQLKSITICLYKHVSRWDSAASLTSGRNASHILGRQKAARRRGVVHVFSGGRYGRKPYRNPSMGMTPTRTDQTDGSG